MSSLIGCRIQFLYSNYVVKSFRIGGYLAKCYLQSRAADSARRNHHDDTGLFPVAQCRTMEIPVIAVLNRFECKSLAFIAVYKSIFVQEFASSIFNYCYEITGTTLNPKWSQTRC
ncbi:unnamed protein product [Rotaria magnacalcarata]|uniref:Uncharacterized protein n=1 Tax=Rotaria magnacalcarata TaxID=392030 RepID=A0A8S2UEF0_9BILA|nr:unnamed protein product [Rotaria magnacalcarata]